MIDYVQITELLTTAYSPSGCESQAKNLLKKVVSPFVDKCYEDIHGNLVCFKDNKSTHTLMLIAHIDEVGLMVKYIEENGFIRFAAIGGIDASILFGTSVVILHGEEKVFGVIGSVPIHMKLSKQEKNIDIADLWIDIGAESKEEAEQIVSVGDGISIESNYHQLANNLISSRALDDKAGIAVLAKLLENLSGESQDFNIFAVASIQEEVGTRGAITSTYAINPDICIAIDVTHATDYPSINRAKYGDIKVNGGVVIPFGSDFSHALQNKMKKIASLNSINYQLEARPGFSGTDIHAVQVSRGGCITGLLSIPCRYMHSQKEIVSVKDMNCTSLLLTELCKLKFEDIASKNM